MQFQQAAREIGAQGPQASILANGDQFIFHADQLSHPVVLAEPLVVTDHHVETLGPADDHTLTLNHAPDFADVGHEPHTPHWDLLHGPEGFHRV